MWGLQTSIQIVAAHKVQLIALIIFAIQHVINTQKALRIACDGIIFDNVYYDKKVIISNLGTPYNLVMHKFSGILFFSHTIKSVTQVDFGIMACHVKSGECMDVKGIKAGYAVAYDAGNDDVFFGGDDGIYKFNFLTKEAEFFAEDGKSIWGIFIAKNFYYIEYPSQKLHVLQGDKFGLVAEASKIEIDTFYISRVEDVYYSNKTALFKVMKNTRRRLVLDDEIVVRQIAEDSYGDVYFCGSDGVYIEDKPYHLKKTADIPKAFGVTFGDNDNVIYSDYDAIYRLEPSPHAAECASAIETSEKEKEDSRVAHLKSYL